MPGPRRVRLPGIPSRLFAQIGLSLASVWNPSNAQPIRGHTSKMPKRSRCAFRPAILSPQLPYRGRYHRSNERDPRVAHPGLRPLVQRLLPTVHPGATVPTRSSHSRPGCGLVALSRPICCPLKICPFPLCTLSVSSGPSCQHRLCFASHLLLNVSMTISWQANCVSFPCVGLGYSGSCALAHLGEACVTLGLGCLL